MTSGKHGTEHWATNPIAFIAMPKHCQCLVTNNFTDSDSKPSGIWLFFPSSLQWIPFQRKPSGGISVEFQHGHLAGLKFAATSCILIIPYSHLFTYCMQFFSEEFLITLPDFAVAKLQFFYIVRVPRKKN
jgi:hypothetical protein